MPYDHEEVEVTGVVADFRYNLLINRNEIDPLVMRNVPANFAYATLLLSQGNLNGTLTGIQKKWKELDPAHSFRYRFFDAQLAATHQGIFDLVSVIGFIALIAVTIACLGLLGMATYTSERRRKEVGIRKVMGEKNR